MSSHPCRAHHKLKWARKEQSGLGVLYEHIPRSESSKTIITVKNRSKTPLPSNALPPAQTPQGQPCLTGVGNNPLTIPKPSQRAVSRMPKARRSRLSLTRCAGWATPQHTYPTQRRTTLHAPLLIFFRVCLKRNNSQTQVDFASVQGINPKA